MAPPELAAEFAELWELWVAVQTQWRVAFGGVVGLDYGAVCATAEMMLIEVTPVVFARLQRLEGATLQRQAERTAKD